MTLQFHAYRRSSRGQIEQVLVTKRPGQPSEPMPTGVIYKTDRAASADCARLNNASASARTCRAKHGLVAATV